MARIHPVNDNELPASVQVALERQATSEYAHPVTNTKSTLAYSIAAFEVYNKLEPLFEELKKVLGTRQAALYAYNISLTTGCSLCAANFKKLLADAGIDFENSLCLTETEKRLINFGNAITKYHGHIADHVYNELAALYTKTELVVIIAFAGQIIATNIFNNTVETEIDEHLAPYALK